MLPFIPLITGAVELFKGRQERKAASEKAEAKLRLNAQAGKHEIVMTDADWEAAAVRSQSNGWKDELVVIVFMLPVISLFLGAIITAFDADTGAAVMKAGQDAITALNGIDVTSTYGVCLMAAVSAAVGIKLVGRR